MRKFCAVILGVLLSPAACACSMGMGLYFEQGIPQGYTPVYSRDALLDQLVKETLGNRGWVYAGSAYHIKVPEIAENPRIVPLTIDLSPNEMNAHLKSIIVVAEKQIDVLVTKKHLPQITNRNGQVPIDLKLNTIAASALNKVAEYNISHHAISQLTMRLNLADTSKVRIAALLVPRDSGQPVRVIHQNETTRVFRSCDRTIYVDGPMPKGARRGFYYF